MPQVCARAGTLASNLTIVSRQNMLSANLFNWKKTRARVCDKLLCFDALAGDAAQSKGKGSWQEKKNALQAGGCCCPGGSGAWVGGPVFGTVSWSLNWLRHFGPPL